MLITDQQQLSTYLIVTFEKTFFMTTQEIANRLVELCQKGDFETAQKELFAEDAVSIEPHAHLLLKKKPKV